MFTFDKDQAQDICSLKEWLLQRQQYANIITLNFFKKFKTFKIFRSWRSNILKNNRQLVEQKLVKNLYILDPVFGPIMMEHRKNCSYLEWYRVVDLDCHNNDSMSISEFKK